MKRRLVPIFGILVLGTVLGFTAGCGEKSDGTENAAPPPSANAVAPPVVPNGVKGGPGDLKPGMGAPGAAAPR